MISLPTTDQQYYENEEFWGKGNVVSLQEFTDTLMLGIQNNSLFRHLNPTFVSVEAKRALEKFSREVKPTNVAITVQVGPQLIFPHPRFMRGWHRISVVNDCGTLTKLEENKMVVAGVHDYLQDNEHNLLFDEAGEVLEGDLDDYEFGACSLIPFSNCSDGDCQCQDVCCDTGEGKYKDSWMRDVPEAGYFQFSPDLEDAQIVIEFATIGLNTMNDCDIPVHKDLAFTLEYWVKWRYLESQGNIGANKIEYFRRRYIIEKTNSRNIFAEKISLRRIVEIVNLTR